jgi:hypothetical protein
MVVVVVAGPALQVAVTLSTLPGGAWAPMSCCSVVSLRLPVTVYDVVADVSCRSKTVPFPLDNCQKFELAPVFVITNVILSPMAKLAIVLLEVIG